MDEAQFENYLHSQIPLSSAMQMAVDQATQDSIILSAPLLPNINHMRTIFGGSASALAILAAWSLVHLRLRNAGLQCAVVIQSNQMDYARPIHGRFTATSYLPDISDWSVFLRTLQRKSLARIEVHSVLKDENIVAGKLKGRFVAFLENNERTIPSA